MITGNYKIAGMSSNNYNILEAKLNGNTIYTREEENPYYIEYTVDTTSTKKLNEGSTTFKYGLPRIYTSTSSYKYPDAAEAASLGISVQITLNDEKGTITDNLSTTCNQIAKVKVIYPENTVAVKFYGSSATYSPKIKTVNYIKTDNFTDMREMFLHCQSLYTINTVGWNTEKVITMESMFEYCTSLISVNASNLNTSNVTNMSYMFSDCDSLTSLDLSNFNTSNVTNMSYMFSDCDSLTSLDLSNFNTSKVTNRSYMFSSVPSTVNWHYDGTNYTNFTLTESQTNFSGKFPWNFYVEFTAVSNANDELSSAIPTFYEGNTTVPYTRMEVRDTTNATLDSSDLTVPLSTVGTIKIWYSDKVTRMQFTNKVKTVTSIVTQNFTSMDYMFYNCKDLQSINSSNWRTSNVTSMSMLFYYCSSLTSLDLSNFNTSKVTNMSYMFYLCSSLSSLNISNFNTSNVTNMYGMFSNCTKLNVLDLSHFNTSKVTDMRSMFSNCTKLNVLDLSNFDMTNCNYMDEDYGCMIGDIFYKVPSTVEWRYDGSTYTSYSDCKNELNIWSSHTKFSGTFPWNKGKIASIDYSTSSTLPTYPSWFSRIDTSTTYFKPTIIDGYYGLWSYMKNDDGIASATFKIIPSDNISIKITVRYDTENSYDELIVKANVTNSFTLDEYTSDVILCGSGSQWDSTTTTKTFFMRAGITYYLCFMYSKDGSGSSGQDGALIQKIDFYYQ